MAELPTTFGKYTLVDKLATGGMAEIYLARLVGPDGFEKPLVLKLIHPRLSRERAFVELFVAEAKALVELAHGRIVPVYELGVVGETYFIAMEYVDGPTLHRLVEAAAARGEALAPPMAAWIAARVLEGLDYAHRKGEGLIHRDLSPRNVLISRDGEVKLVDFGIAIRPGAPGEADAGDDQAPTGSYPYMSPEQVRRGALTARSDLFSVGVLLWEMLVGEPLFARGTAEETLAAVADAPVPPPSGRRAGVPAPLDEVVARALERDPAARWPDAAAMLAPLLRYLYRLDDPPGPREVAALVARCCPPEVGPGDAARGAGGGGAASPDDDAAPDEPPARRARDDGRAEPRTQVIPRRPAPPVERTFATHVALRGPDAGARAAANGPAPDAFAAPAAPGAPGAPRATPDATLPRELGAGRGRREGTLAPDAPDAPDAATLRAAADAAHERRAGEVARAIAADDRRAPTATAGSPMLPAPGRSPAPDADEAGARPMPRRPAKVGLVGAAALLVAAAAWTLGPRRASDRPAGPLGRDSGPPAPTRVLPAAPAAPAVPAAPTPPRPGASPPSPASPDAPRAGGAARTGAPPTAPPTAAPATPAASSASSTPAPSGASSAPGDGRLAPPGGPASRHLAARRPAPADARTDANAPTDAAPSRPRAAPSPRAAAANSGTSASTAGTSASTAGTSAPAAGANARGAGTLRIGAAPWGEIYVDGVPAGRTPRAVPVAAGAHAIVIVFPVDEPPRVARFAVQVRDGDEVPIQADFTVAGAAAAPAAVIGP